jgi:hypothetical protein
MQPFVMANKNYKNITKTKKAEKRVKQIRETATKEIF